MPPNRNARDRSDRATVPAASMRVLRCTVAAVAAGAAMWISVDLLHDAYGGGAPYYGRTTNMDKWTSPWPAMLVIGGTALAVVFGAFWPRNRRRNKDQ